MTRAALKHAARMRERNLETRRHGATIRHSVAAFKGWRNRRARIIRQREKWCLEQLRQRGTI